jgi:hypothetical protein
LSRRNLLHAVRIQLKLNVKLKEHNRVVNEVTVKAKQREKTDRML